MKTINTLIQLSLIFVFSLVSSIGLAASKSDLAKEKRWEAQIVDSLLVGEGIKLNANGTDFLALYAKPSTQSGTRAVILLHGIGVHPAWPEVIDPLRMQLPDHGWHTLSLQMPILHNEATDVDYPPLFPEVLSRIQAGVDFLKSKGINHIVLAGHSLGSSMALSYLANKPDGTVKAVAILSGGGGVPGDKYADSLATFQKISNVEIIDVYGSMDHENVFKQLISRKSIGMKKHKQHYHVLKIEGANHFYRDRQDELVEALNKKLLQISH